VPAGECYELLVKLKTVISNGLNWLKLSLQGKQF